MIKLEKLLWIADTYTDIGVPLTNFTSPHVARLTGPPRRAKIVDEIVIHETVTRSVETTIKVLKKRNLGAHFIIAREGAITQHGDLVLDRLAHAGRFHNSHSVGIEIVNPYYPKYNKSAYWGTTISARWAHGKKYVVPLRPQAESTYQLVKALLDLKEDRFDVPHRWVGLDPKRRRYTLGRVTCARWHVGGVLAHNNFGHADGSWPVLYCILREARPIAGANWAYDRAIALAATNRRFVDLTGIV